MLISFESTTPSTLRLKRFQEKTCSVQFPIALSDVEFLFATKKILCTGRCGKALCLT